MPVTKGNTDPLVADLLERLARVETAAEGSPLFLQLVCAEASVERGVLVLRADDGSIRGAGFGVPEQRANAFLAAMRDAEGPARELVSTSNARVIQKAAYLPHLEFRAAVAIPIGFTEAAAVGVVLLETDRLDERMESVRDLARRCAPALIRCFERDVLESRRNKLERQRDLLTSVVEALPDPVLLTSHDNDILLTNSRANELFSTAAEDSEGRRRAIQINNLLFSSFLTQTVISNGKTANRELNLVDPSEGSDLLFEVISVLVPSSRAAEGAVISILRDITDLKRALQELEAQFTRSRLAEHTARQQRDRLNAVLENVGDPILVTDDESRIVLLNREADRLFVVPPDWDLESVESRVVQANDTKFTTMISDFLLQLDHVRAEKLELTDPDSGRSFPAEVLSTKVLNSRGEAAAIVSVVHDLTQVVENERLAAELQRLNEDLEDRIGHATEELEERNRRLEWQSQELSRVSRLKSEFLANMSHELRTPINVILGYTSLMRERIYGDLTNQQDEGLEKIYTTSQHLLELINDILDLSKIEAGKMPVHAEDFRLEDLIDELATTIGPMLRKKDVVFRSELAEDLPPLNTDRTKLKQILLNLFSNAIKFTHEGSVSVRAEPGPREGILQIEVKDTGIGIRAEHLDSIFEDFRQVDQSHTRQYGGTGLGLSITRKLLALLGGEITVRSAFGAGSTFTVEVPFRLRGDESAQAARLAPEAPALKG